MKKRGTKAYALKVPPSTHPTNRNSPRQNVSVFTITFCRIILKLAVLKGQVKQTLLYVYVNSITVLYAKNLEQI